MNNQDNSSRKDSLKKIQAYSFSVLETALYLDGHPDNEQALEHYETSRNSLRQALAEYETEYGPITMFNNDISGGWKWISEPWPWQKEAN